MALIFCNVGVAEEIELRCEIKDYNLEAIKKNDRDKFIGETIVLVVDTEKKVIRNSNPGYADIIHGVLEELTLEKGQRLLVQDFYFYKSEIPLEDSDTIYKYEGKIKIRKNDKTLSIEIDDGSTISKLVTK